MKPIRITVDSNGNAYCPPVAPAKENGKIRWFCPTHDFEINFPGLAPISPHPLQGTARSIVSAELVGPADWYKYEVVIPGAKNSPLDPWLDVG